MKEKIILAVKGNITYIILAILVASAVITGIAVSSNGKSEKIIIRSDSKPVSESSDVDLSSDSNSSEASKAVTTTVKTETSATLSSVKASTSQADETTTTEETKSSTVFPIDVNTVTEEQLIEINGIGEVTANKIIAYRNSIGVIYNMDLLTEISGIGDSTLSLLKEYLYVSDYDYREIYVEAEQTEVVTEIITEEPIETETAQTQASTVQTQEAVDDSTIQRVNVNTANAEEISQKLKINISVAENIVALREQIHEFTNVLELLYADGMSEKLLSQLRDYIEL